MNSANAILKKIWGHDQFRPLQEEIIQSAIDGHDTLALLPTGGGKSICFQVPALMKEGICLVISPLIALMLDQVSNLKARNIPAIAIYSGMSKRAIDIALDNCIYGKVKFLYISPERLKTSLFQERVKKMQVNFLVVDEAHCISQWGHDFRPSYLSIAEIKPLITNVPVIALTASATNDVQLEIVTKLEMKEAAIFQKSFSRKNLSYAVFKEEDKDRKMLSVLRNVSGSAIVYTMSRKATKEVTMLLRSKNISADFYHAGLSTSEREHKQKEWIGNRFKVMVATNAFGMGIDKPDVRAVIHYELPQSMEAYYQEAGRAGRDEKTAYAVLLFNQLDISILKKSIANATPTIEALRNTYQSLANYFKLAVGSGEMSSHDIDFTDFTSNFKLEPLPTFHAIKKLASEGFVQLNEGFSSPSTLMIKSGNQDLYAFQIANVNFDPLIKALLRMYGGELFINYLAIDEGKLATLLSEGKSKVIRLLKTLDELEVIDYQPRKEEAQLTFLTPRYDAKALPLEEGNLNFRNKIAQEKAMSVVKYAENTIQCRTQHIVGYFGETTNKLCGICDICLRRKNEKSKTDREKQIKISLIQSIENSAQFVQDIIEQLPEFEEQEIVYIIRTLLDEGKIRYLESGEIDLIL